MLAQRRLSQTAPRIFARRNGLTVDLVFVITVSAALFGIGFLAALALATATRAMQRTARRVLFPVVCLSLLCWWGIMPMERAQ